FDLALSRFYTPEGFETPHYYATGPDGAKKAVIGEWNMYQEQAKQAEKGKKEREAILQEQAKFKNK
ncbi:MAG: hypothetical protein FWC51_02110, partial [Proteobacteria bacterium]|nr:hypothetical protein [Pseudomonadota bacterium]